jgi:hypothetical protein
VIEEPSPSLVLFTVGSLPLADNPALQAALARHGPIIPIFPKTAIGPPAARACGGWMARWPHLMPTCAGGARV